MSVLISTSDVAKVLANTPYADFSAERMHSGVSTVVFRLTKGFEVVYLRIIPPGELLETEVLAHKLFLAQHLHVPEVLFSRPSEEIFHGLPYSITTEIRGKSVLDSPELTKVALTEIIFIAGQELAQINKNIVQGVGWITATNGDTLVSNTNDYHDFALHNLPQKYTQLINAGVLKTAEVQQIEKYIENNAKIIDLHDNSALAHGDFCTDHIYQSKGKFSGIIDFGDIRGTTIYHDLAHFYTFNPELFDTLLAGYISITTLPYDFMRSIKYEAVIFGIRKLAFRTENASPSSKSIISLKKFLIELSSES